MDIFKTLKGIIYLIQNKINGKSYFGQAIGSFYSRYSGGRWWIWSKNDHLLSAAKKYGHENFSVEILHSGLSFEELNGLETLYIETCKSDWREYGYNKKKGGFNGSFSKELQVEISKKLTVPFKEFVKRAKDHYGDEYEFDESSYQGTRSKVKATHLKCGTVLIKTAYDFSVGNGLGCRKCRECKKTSKEERLETFRKWDKNEWSYNLSDYEDCYSTIDMVHNPCGLVYKRTARQHNRLKKCPVCFGEKKYIGTKPFNLFVSEANLIHNEEYEYDKGSYFISSKKMKIIHKLCGRIFFQSPNAHLGGHGCGFCNRSKNSKRKKTVYQIDISSGKIVKEYISASEAGRILNLKTSSITKVCNGRQHTAHGFIWRYKNGK